jgi:alpha-beta hydrolase superfamily lysophospholipase
LAPGGESWDAAAERLGQAHVSRAATFEATGSLALAGQEHEWAAAAFNIGQLLLNTDSARKAALYARASAQLQHAASRPGGDVLRLALGADDREKLYGWELPVENPVGAVVVIGGLSGWGASFLALARALTRRRIAVILAEGPGQGETRLVSKLHLSREALPVFTPFIDRARRFSTSVALVGNSFGGLIAAHIAAARDDILACCVNSSPVRLRTPQFPAEREQISAAFGADGDALAQKIAAFNFDPAVEHIQCPMLILEGGADKLVPPGVQIEFVGGDASAGRAILQLWPDGLHTLYNHAAERNTLIGVWLTDRFLTRRSNRR